MGWVRRAVRFELDIYRNLYRWVRGTTVGITPDAVPFSYYRANELAVWGFIGVAVVELPLIHFLIPWETVRIVLLVLGLWTLVWMVGYAGSLRVHPHLVSDQGIRVRYATGLDLLLPWEQVAAVRWDSTNHLDDATYQVTPIDPERPDAGDILSVVIMSQTNVEVDLSAPVDVDKRRARGRQIQRVRFRADDARALVNEANHRLAADSNPRQA